MTVHETKKLHLFLKNARDNGWTVLGASNHPPTAASDAPSKPVYFSNGPRGSFNLEERPTVLVLGSEGGGVAPHRGLILRGVCFVPGRRGGRRRLFERLP